MELVQSGFISRSKLSALMAANPAEILGISKGETAKGYLLPGFMADLIICDEQKDWIVEPEKFYSKGKYTPLKNKHLKGKVLQVIHHGKKIFPFE